MERKDQLTGGAASFLARWARRKQEARAPTSESAAGPVPDPPAPRPPPDPAARVLTDADMPPIESLTDADDWSPFMSPGVSDDLRGQALRRLFASPRFNVTDGLDSYSGDYTHYEPLGDTETADMRHQRERLPDVDGLPDPDEPSPMKPSHRTTGTALAAADPRAAALAAMADVAVKGTGIVNYATAGRVLVVGPDDRAVALARQLPPPLVPTVLVLDAVLPRVADLTVVSAERRGLSLTGHLGAFEVRLSPAAEAATFDQVVDLCRPPLLSEPWRRFGYHAPAGSAETAALTEALLDQVGDLEKPRYFRYDPSLCVRGRSGMIACNRCVQACPAGAITGLAERVEVDPYLCQGAGICATVCPGGAMQYAYPPLDGAVHRLRRLLEAYRAAGGQSPEVLIHEAETPPALEALPANVLPYAVEEVGSLGIEAWLSALAFGARAVRVQRSPRATHELSFALEVQFGDAGALLDGLGLPAGAIGWSDAPDQSGMPPIRPAAYSGLGSKREVLFLALDHLIAESPAAGRAEIELPATVPMGEVVVDPRRCTLCVACATVCPRGAISAEEGTPALVFFEARCVQCGLCERACPERAIRMRARLLTDREARSRRRTLHEEPPLVCISCGKPFATQSSLDRVLATLGKRGILQDEAARRRLRMCADCRVADLMRSGGAN